jgi:hypothetical protein
MHAGPPNRAQGAFGTGIDHARRAAARARSRPRGRARGRAAAPAAAAAGREPESGRSIRLLAPMLPSGPRSPP